MTWKLSTNLDVADEIRSRTSAAAAVIDDISTTNKRTHPSAQPWNVCTSEHLFNNQTNIINFPFFLNSFHLRVKIQTGFRLSTQTMQIWIEFGGISSKFQKKTMLSWYSNVIAESKFYLDLYSMFFIFLSSTSNAQNFKQCFAIGIAL